MKRPLASSGAQRSLLAGLRRPGDETQLTRAFASIASADVPFASRFLRLVLESASGRSFDVPDALAVTTEEVAGGERFDLRFRADGEWDVIVELKIHAGYGRHQLKRYLAALDDVDNAFVCAITRDVPLYGEPPVGVDPQWAGSVRWRDLLPALRELPVKDPLLGSQWLVFLDVLEEEGSMGFTRPDAELFTAWSLMRRASGHVEEFVEAVRWPILAALHDALGGGTDSADFYRTRGGRPVLSRGKWGKADMPIRVPGDGDIRIRVGLFGYNPPTRFVVAPHNGRRWLTRLRSLPPEGQHAVEFLLERGFRDYDLHAFLELDEELLASPTLEEDVVFWTRERFGDIIASGLLSVAPPGGRKGTDDEDEGI